jgi:hypothetical protein
VGQLVVEEAKGEVEHQEGPGDQVGEVGQQEWEEELVGQQEAQVDHQSSLVATSSSRRSRRCPSKEKHIVRFLIKRKCQTNCFAKHAF